MALNFADRVKETTATTGIGTLNLAGAVTQFQTFLAGIGSGNDCYYGLISGNGTDWEVGLGTVTSGSPNTLSRPTILASSNGGSAISLTGTSTVWCDVPAGVITQPISSIIRPQGRATLQTGVPVMTADQTAKSTIFYDTYDTGNLVPVYNGSRWVYLVIGADEISMGLDAVTPHIASGSAYDIWAFSVAGVLTIGAGPAWSSTTSRGTGAGTTEWQWLNGVRVNKNSLTHVWGGASGTTDLGSIPAQQATLVCSFYATANGQTGMAFAPAAASGGGNPFLALYNAYNRVPVMSRSQDSGGSAGYTYASTTWRTVRASSSNRVTWFDGLQESFIDVSCGHLAKGFGTVGATIDSTTNAPVNSGQGIGDAGATSTTHIHVSDTFPPLLGLHFAQAMEVGASGTATFFTGGTSPARQDQYINVRLEM